MNTSNLKLQKAIKARISDVYNVFADASQLSKWFTTNARADLRVGGKYSNDDTDEGTYLEIVKNRKLRFTWDNKGYCPRRVAFYYLGAGEAILLDEINSPWRKEYFKSKFYLEKYFNM